MYPNIIVIFRDDCLHFNESKKINKRIIIILNPNNIESVTSADKVFYVWGIN